VAEYRRYIPKLPSQTQQTLGGALRTRFAAPESDMFKVLGALTIPLEALTGAARQLVEESEGAPHKSLYQASLEGIRERTSWVDVVRDKTLGTALNFLADPNPVYWIPAAAVGKFGGKGFGLAASAVRKLPGGRRALYELGVHFRANYALTAGDFNDYIAIKNAHFGRLNQIRWRNKETVAGKVIELVPDERRRMMLVMLRDMEPETGLLPDGTVFKPAAEEVTKWEALRGRMKLTPKEQEAYKVLDEGYKWLEETKIGAGGLEAKRAAGFVRATGVKHVPRRAATRSRAIAEIERVLKEHRFRLRALSRAKAAGREVKGKKVRGQDIRAVKKSAELLKKWLDELKAMPEDLNVPITKRFQQAIDAGKLPPFLKPSKTKGTRIVDLDDEMIEWLEMDAAKLFDLEEREVMAALSRQRFLDNSMHYLMARGQLLPERFAEYTAEQLTEAVTKMGRGKRAVAGFQVDPEMLTRYRAGKTKPLNLKLPAHLKGVEQRLGRLHAPVEIAEEVERVMNSYLSYDSLKEAMSMWRKMTRFYKAWTLSPFPAYHWRNFLSNLWNNYLAGMGVDSLQDYHAAAPLLRDWLNGNFDTATKFGKYKQLTSRQLFDRALRDRVLAGGTYAEFEDILSGLSRRHKLSDLVDPRPSKSLVLDVGYRTGRFIEDHARLSHYLYQIRKGKSFDEAAKSVHKYLFDYEYGLSQFESRVLRDRLLPFYTWTRFNLPLQFEMLAKQPQKFANFIKAKNALEEWAGGPEPSETVFVEWLRNASKVRIHHDEKTGTSTYFFLASFWPGEEIGKALSGKRIMNEALGLLTPILKVPSEVLANYDLWRRRPISEIPGQTRKLIGVPLPARVEHMFRSVRLLNEIDRTIASFDAKYGGGIAQRAFRAGGRAMFGKPYPVSHEAQLRAWDFETQFRLRELGLARARFKRDNDRANLERAEKAMQSTESRLVGCGQDKGERWKSL
jgi:hypothetical protein